MKRTIFPLAFILFPILWMSFTPLLISPTILIGTWKIKDKNIYEKWHSNSNTSLEGISYKLEQDKKEIMETLSIKKQGGKWVYTALVKGQNNNQPIAFKLNTALKDTLSFENPKHDFPVKIQYTKVEKNILNVMVLGHDNKGFSYQLIKVD